NSPGFSFGEIRKMFGGSSYNINRQVFNYGAEGIITSRNQGLNYADDWGKKADITTNYFGSISDTENEIRSERENILSDNRFFTNLNSISNVNAKKHSTETKIKIKPDSTLLITVEPKLRYTQTINDFSSTEQSFDTNGDIVNSTLSSRSNKNTEEFFSNNLNLTKKLGKKGSFIKFDFFTRFTNNESENFLDNNVQIFGDNPEDFDVNQLREIDGQDNTFVLASTYRIPLKGKKLTLDIGLGHRNNIQKNNTNSFDFDETTQAFQESVNEDFSSDFEYENITTTPNVMLEYKKGKWTSSFKLDYIYRTLLNTDFLRPQFNLKRNFTGADISYNLNHRSPKSALGLRYNLRNGSPSLAQLQPVVNITNPLNIVQGNPELEPSNTHNLSVYYNKNNFQKGAGLYTYISADIQNNNVISKTNIDENLVRQTTYANVDGGYRLFGQLDMNRKIKLDSLKSIRLNGGIYTNLTRSVNFVNDVQYAALSKTVAPNVGLGFTWNQVTEIGANYSISFTDNSFNTEFFNNQEFMYHSLFFRTTNYFKKKFDLRNEIRYNYNPNVADGFQKSTWFWNATLAYSFMKDKATLTLKAYDLLNQNINIRRIANQNFIEDRQSTVLQQYFMLSFSWKFNTLGKAGETRNSGGFRVVY
ncbi:MAG: outer membrane beta-barrel protein, partial [Flavobacteriaceae bacterium]